MGIDIVRLPASAGTREDRQEAYEARSPDGLTLWRVGVDLGEPSPSTFRGVAIWNDAAVVAVGARNVVVLLDASTGTERSRISVPSCFGHLSVQPVDGVQWLFVLGWKDIHAYGPDLCERWVSRGVAVDGITDATVQGSLITINAEMDPPGGWFSVQLDVRTGREVARAPNFTNDYLGIYGAGKNRR